MRAIDSNERRRRTEVRHRLSPGARFTSDPLSIADDMVALHASDPATVYLSVLARQVNPSTEAIAEALYGKGSDGGRVIVRHHAMRRTLWVMGWSFANVAHQAVSLKVAMAERKRLLKLLDSGPTSKRGDDWLDDAIDRVAALTTEAGPLTTREIGGVLPDLAFKVTAGGGTRHSATVNAHTRIVVQAGFEYRLVRTAPQGSWTASNYRWVAPGCWSGEDPTLEIDQAAAKAALVLRWLERFGPGTSADLAWWTGMTTSDVARAVRHGVDNATVEPVRLPNGEGWDATANDAPTEESGPWVALLPGLDPTPMGWKDRSWYLPTDIVPSVVDRNGNIGPTIWADGQIVGGWAQRPDGDLATVLYRDLSADHLDLLSIEVDRLRDAVGETRFRVRFPSPNQRDLLA